METRILPATPIINVTDSAGTFNGYPYPATATVAGVNAGIDDTPGPTLQGVGLTLTYYLGWDSSGSPLAGGPVHAGTYTVVVSFPGCADYDSADIQSTFTIGKETNPGLTVTAPGGTYNGSPYSGSVTVAGIVTGLDATPGPSLEGVSPLVAYYQGSAAVGLPLSGPPTEAGLYTFDAVFPGSTDYGGAVAVATFAISRAPSVLTVTATGGVFNGSPFAATATVTGVVAGVDDAPASNLEGVSPALTYYGTYYLAGGTVPLQPGMYTADAVFPGSTDYSGAHTQVTFTITPAAPILSLTATGGAFNGYPFAATASIAGILPGVDDTPGVSLEGSTPTLQYSDASSTHFSSPPTQPGTYSVDYDFTGTRDYADAGSQTTFTISSATPIVTVQASGGAYTGQPYTASATVAGVVAGVDNTPSPTLEGTSVRLTYYAGATATGTPLDGAPSQPGAYTVDAAFSGSTDYAAVDSPASFTIYQPGDATPALNLAAAGGTYNGSPFPATATVAGVIVGVDDTPGPSLEGTPLVLQYYSGSSAVGTPLSCAPSQAGTYTVAAHFAGSIDYGVGDSQATFTITPAAPVITVAASGGTFDGSAFGATATVAGVSPGTDDTPGPTLEGTGMLLRYFDAGETLLPGAPYQPGTFTVDALFPGSPNYASGEAQATFTIAPPTPVVYITAASGTYSGSAFVATATIAGVRSGVDDTPGTDLEGVGLTLAYYDGTETTGTPLTGPPSLAGTYTVDATFPGSLDYAACDTQATLIIDPAAPFTIVSAAGGTYNGTPYAATGTVAGVVPGLSPAPSLEGTDLVFLYYSGTSASGMPLLSAPAQAGTYTVDAFFGGSPDYAADDKTATFTITKATPVLNVSDAGGGFTGAPFPATATVAGVVSGVDDTPSVSLESTGVLLVYYTESGTPLSGAPTQPGTYTVVASYSGSSDYLATDATAGFTILPAPTLTPNQSFSLDEGSAVGAVVGTVSANDTDTSQTLTFAITAGNTGGAFQIDSSTGQISVASSTPLDFAVNPTFSLTVQVADAHAPPLTAIATIIINLNDTHSHAPSIYDQSFSVDEKSRPGAVVGTVLAYDIDPGQELTYAITAGNVGDTFAIDASTGVITVASHHGINFTTNFVLAITVTDNATPAMSSTGHMTITDQDLEPYGQILSLEPNLPFQGVIGRIYAYNPYIPVADITVTTIDWGDGTITTGDAHSIVDYGNGIYDVLGTHAYAAAGTYDLSITVNEVNDGSTTFPAFAVVAPAMVTFVNSPSASVVAAFTCPSYPGTPQSFQATIEWSTTQLDEDGIPEEVDHVSQATVIWNGGSYDVYDAEATAYMSSSHAGVRVTVTGPDSCTNAEDAWIAVHNLPLPLTGMLVSPPQYNGGGDWVVATASEYASATVIWSNGSVTYGTTTDADGGPVVAPGFVVVDSNMPTVSTVILTSSAGVQLTLGSPQGTAPITWQGNTPMLSLTPLSVRREDPTDFQVGTFAVPDGNDPSQYPAVIAWGDGTPSTTAEVIRLDSTSSWTTYAVVGNHHVYTHVGNYQLSVSVSGGMYYGVTLVATVATNVEVTDEPLQAQSDTPTDITLPANFQASHILLAAFQDPITASRPQDYVTRTVSWGDGTSDILDLPTAAGGGFNLYGDHMYLHPGDYVATVTISDSTSKSVGSWLSFFINVHVTSSGPLGPPDHGIAVNVYPQFGSVGSTEPFILGNTITGLVLGTVEFDPRIATIPLHGTVAWGDGTTSDVALIKRDPNDPTDYTYLAVFHGTHTFYSGSYLLTLTVERGIAPGEEGVSGSNTILIQSSAATSSIIVQPHNIILQHNQMLTRETRTLLATVTTDAPFIGVYVGCGNQSSEYSATPIDGTVQIWAPGKFGTIGRFKAKIVVTAGDRVVTAYSEIDVTDLAANVAAREYFNVPETVVLEETPGRYDVPLYASGNMIPIVVADSPFWFLNDGSSFYPHFTVQACQGPMTLGWFFDTDPGRQASAFTATIHWSDGETSAGTVLQDAGGFFGVQGTHQHFNSLGYYGGWIDVARQDGGQVDSIGASFEVHGVNNAEPGVIPVNTGVLANLDSGDIVVAVITDNRPGAAASDYLATADGFAPAVVRPKANTANQFEVIWHHVFSDPPGTNFSAVGMHDIPVEIVNLLGFRITVDSTITVYNWSPFDPAIRMAQRTNDPQGAVMLDLGESQVALHTGEVRLTQPLDFDLSPGTQVGGNPALVYNSSAAHPQPILEFVVNNPDRLDQMTSLTVEVAAGGTTVTKTFNTAANTADDEWLRLDVPLDESISWHDLFDWTAAFTYTFADGNVHAQLRGTATAFHIDNFGNGWGLAGIDHLKYDDSTGKIYWITASGDWRVFSMDNNGVYSSPGDYGTLRYKPDSYTCEYTAKDKTLWTFDFYGNLISVKDTDGQQRTYEYCWDSVAQKTRLVKVTAPDGGITTFEYGSYQITIHEPGDRTVRLVIDSNGNLVGITDEAGRGRDLTYDAQHRVTHDVWSPWQTVFSYDDVGRIHTVALGASAIYAIAPGATEGIEASDAHAALVNGDAQGSVTDGLGHATVYSTDLFGRVTSLTTADGAVQSWERNGVGRVTKYTDALGYVTTSKYNAAGDLILENRPDGSSLQFQYNSFHRITREVQSPNAVTVSTYDGAGDLLSTTDPLGLIRTYVWAAGLLMSETDPRGNATLYIYDSHRRLVTTTDANGQPSSTTYDAAGNPATATDAQGRVTLTQYDGRNQLVRQTNPLSDSTINQYDAAGLLTASQDARGTLTTYVYNSQGLQAQVATAGHSTTNTFDVAGNLIASTDALGAITSFCYDVVNRQIETTDPLLKRTQTQFDLNGNIVARIDALGQENTYAYDPAGREISATDALGRTTQNVYNLAGEIVQITDPAGYTTSKTYDSDGRVLTETDALGRTTRYSYDADGALTRTVDPVGNATSETYTPTGQVATRTDANGGVTHYLYDADDRLVQVIDPQGNVTSTSYDTDGRVATETDALGRVTTYSYDADGNVTQTIDPLGNATAETYTLTGQVATRTDANGGVTQYIYDADDRLVQIIDPMGGITSKSYDGDGRALAETDALGRTTSYSYDDDGNLLQTIDPLGNANAETYTATGQVATRTDANGHVTRYLYDADDRLVQIIDALGSITTRTYDGDGRMLTETDPLGRVTTYIYDGDGNLLQTVAPLGNTNGETYTPTGQSATRTDANSHVTRYVYDSDDRLVQVIDAAGNTTAKSYDGDGRVLTDTDALGRVTRYSYDGNGNVLQTVDPAGNTEAETYTPTGQVATRTDANGVTRYFYDGDDRLVQIIDPLGNTTTRTYDAKGRLATERDALGHITNFTYDGDGNLTQRVDPLGNTSGETYTHTGKVATQTDARGGVTRYSYDGDDRLIQVIDPAGNTTSKSYDGNGRVLTETDALGRVTRFAYDGDGNLTQTVDPRGNSTSETYTPTGQVATRTDADGGVTRYFYDEDDRLIQVTAPLGDTTSRTYDANGRVATETDAMGRVGSSRVDLQACKLEYSIVSPK